MTVIAMRRLEIDRSAAAQLDQLRRAARRQGLPRRWYLGWKPWRWHL